MPEKKRPPRVSLFVTCLVDQLRPSTGIATVNLLRRIGCDVEFDPRQTCCGQPAFTTGYWEDARKVAERTVSILEEQQADWIVAPSGSCTAMFRHYRTIFAHRTQWQSRAEAVVARTRELSEFLVHTLQVSDVGAHFDGRVTWHDACHAMRDLGIQEEPRMLLRNVAGLDLVETDRCDACCGFGGAFAVTYPNISLAMADEKLTIIETASVDAVVSSDVACLMQLGGRLRARGSTVRTLHLAELLE